MYTASRAGQVPSIDGMKMSLYGERLDARKLHVLGGAHAASDVSELIEQSN